MIARNSWEVGTFVFKQIPAEINLDIIPKMQSVPLSVKAEMQRREQTLKYRDQLAIVDEFGNVDSYTPSVQDILAHDWIVVLPY